MIDVSMNLKEKTQLKIKEWEALYGGLSLQVEQQINRLLKEYESKKQFTQSIILDSSTVLVREYQGQIYTVNILDKGFYYNQKFYKSLSAIANEITGTHCNGRKFFGVNKWLK